MTTFPFTTKFPVMVNSLDTVTTFPYNCMTGSPVSFRRMFEPNERPSVAVIFCTITFPWTSSAVSPSASNVMAFVDPSAPTINL